MSSTRQGAEIRILREQAAQWVCDIREAGPEKHQEFLAWLRLSPRHVAEYLFAETLWKEAQGTRTPGSMEALIAEARASEGSAEVVKLAPAESGGALRIAGDSGVGMSAGAGSGVRRARAGRLLKLSAIAAGTAVLAVAGFWWSQHLPGHRAYSTTVGEQRSLRLPDGSLLQLNTRSRIEVRFTKHERRLRLLAGEALFDVQPDALRPFLVDANGTTVQALGTQFNVHVQPEGTTVAVVSGLVQVSVAENTASVAAAPTRLAAGEEVRIDSRGRTSRTQRDAAQAVAWRERRLVFRGEALEAVAEEFNRYNQRRIRVEDEKARRKLLSGTFSADSPDSLVLFLRKLDDLEVAARDGELVITSR